MASLEYRYPVWAMLDATFFLSMGNAYKNLEDWDIEANHLSYGVGFRTNTSREVAFEALLAFGTSRLDQPTVEAADSVRFAVGINHGF